MIGTHDLIDLQIADGLARITLDRPDKHNAMTIHMWRRLTACCATIAEDTTVRAVVVSGRGRSFCSGADISNLHEDDATLRVAVEDAQQALRGLPVPTIAAVHGHCWGGGLEIAVSCDLRFATPDASFAVPPARLGVVYPATSIQALLWLIGPAATKRMIFTARPADAPHAVDLGLVDLVTDDLDTAVRDELALLTGRSLLSQAAAKAIVNTLCDQGDHLAQYQRWREIWAASPDAVEGPAAFLEKRPPQFSWHPAHI